MATSSSSFCPSISRVTTAKGSTWSGPLNAAKRKCLPVMAASGTRCFLITVLLAPVSTKIRRTSFPAILPLITAANGSSSMKLICCSFFGQAFANAHTHYRRSNVGPSWDRT